MEALVLVGGTLLVWTVGFWAVGQLDRFFKEKNAPCGGSGRGSPAEKEKFCAGTREKRRDRGKTRGGAQTVFLHSLGPSYSKQVYDRRNKKVWPCCIDFPRKMGRAASAASIRTAPVADRQRCGQLKRPLCGALGVQDLLYEMSATRKPGGCADLLCLSLMLFFLEEKGGPGVDKKEIAIDNGIW